MSTYSGKAIALACLASTLIACSPGGNDEVISRDEAPEEHLDERAPRDAGPDAGMAEGISHDEEPADDGADAALVIRFADMDPGMAGIDGFRDSDATVRQRLVRHQFGLLEGTPAVGDRIGIELFNGVTVVAEVSGVERTESEQVQITATYPDDPFGVFWLRESEFGIVGTIQTRGRFFDLFPVEPGVIQITEFDQGQFPPDRDFGDRSGSGSDFRLELFTPPELPLDSRRPVIRVMVLFPSTVFQQYCAQRALITIADAFEDDINKVWRAAATSDVVALCVPYDPKGKDLVDYVDNGGNWRNYEADTGQSVDVDYEWLRADSTVAALRDRHRADLVAMFLPHYNWCGGAITNDPPVVAADADNAYAVVRFDCARGSYSLQHELGHLVGMRHDRTAQSGDVASNCNYGYVCRQGPAAVGRTVMTYRSSCIAAGGTPRQCKSRFPTYSLARTPLDPFGSAASTCGQPCGGTTTNAISGSADNFRQLRTAAPTVSQFR